MSNIKQRTTAGFSGGILWEMLFAFSGLIALVTFIATLSTRLHAHNALLQALFTATKDAVVGFSITALFLVVAAFGFVHIYNWFGRNK